MCILNVCSLSAALRRGSGPAGQRGGPSLQVAWVSLCVKQGCHLPPVLCLRCHGEKQVTPAEPFANLHGLDECSEHPTARSGVSI